MGRHRKAPDQTTFGHWTFVAIGGPKKWLMRCECGIEREVSSSSLQLGTSKSCGCKKGDMISAAKAGVAVNVKHGMAGTAIYKRWRNMMHRCYKPWHHKYKDYGGRGITVCDAWHDFATWYADVGDPPQPGLSFDRVDNDGNYEPGNWRWATVAEQLANRRKYKSNGRLGWRKNPGKKL